MKSQLAVCGEAEGQVLGSVFTRASQLLADLLQPELQGCDPLDFAAGSFHPLEQPPRCPFSFWFTSKANSDLTAS